MFKRMILEDWQNIVPFVSTGVALGIFLLGVILALLMRKEKVDHLANLPLENHQDNAKPKH